MLHARIVEALEALAGDRLADQVERLAHHALRGEVWDKALTYARQAGEKALERSAYREAVVWFEQALSVLPHLPETRDTCERAIDLRAALGDALWPLGDHQRRFASLCQAETLATAMDDARRLSRISIQMVHHFRVMGDDEQAIAYGQQALTLATTLGELRRQCEAHLVLGRTYYAMSDYRQAIASFRQVVTSFAEERLPAQTHRWVTTAVLSRVWLGLCLAEHGEFAEALRHADAAIRLADMADHPYSRIHAYFGVGGVYLTPRRCRQGHRRARTQPWAISALGIPARIPVDCRPIRLCLYPRWPCDSGAAPLRARGTAGHGAPEQQSSTMGRLAE